jgi:hypothetical protein
VPKSLFNFLKLFLFPISNNLRQSIEALVPLFHFKLKPVRMKFGFDQRNKPTPAKINLWVDFIVGICGVLAGFTTNAHFISHSVADVSGSVITALIIPVLLLFKRFFGNDGNAAESTDTAKLPEMKIVTEEKTPRAKAR